MIPVDVCVCLFVSLGTLNTLSNTKKYHGIMFPPPRFCFAWQRGWYLRSPFSRLPALGQHMVPRTCSKSSDHFPAARPRPFSFRFHALDLIIQTLFTPLSIPPATTTADSMFSFTPKGLYDMALFHSDSIPHPTPNPLLPTIPFA